MNARRCCRSASVWNSRLDPLCAALAAALSTGPPNSRFGLDRNPHQDDAAHHVHQHMRRDRDDHDDGQHHQRVRAAAGQHAIGHVEQVDRDGEHQQVDRNREDPDGHHVAAGVRQAPAEHVAEFIVAGTLVQRRRLPPPPPPPLHRRRNRRRPCHLPCAAGEPEPSARSRRWIPAAGLGFRFGFGLGFV